MKGFSPAPEYVIASALVAWRFRFASPLVTRRVSFAVAVEV